MTVCMFMVAVFCTSTDDALHVGDRAWVVRLYGEIIPELQRGDYRPYRRTNHTLSHLYHNNQFRPAHYGVSRAKDWVSVDCGTNTYICLKFHENIV